MSSFALSSATRPEPARTFRELCDPNRLAETVSLERGLRRRAIEIPEDLHREAVERVAAMYRAAIRDLAGAEAVFQPSGEWKAYLDERRRVYDAMLAGDGAAAGEILRTFWRGELGPIVKEYARFDQLESREEPFTSRFVERVTRNYLIWRRFVGADPLALETPNVGNVWGLEIDGRVIAPKACRFHALASQTRELLRAAGGGTVAELGGGYGGLAQMLLRDEPGASYVEFDLPETLAIAAYFLIGACPNRRVTLYGEPGWQETIGQPGATLLPHYAIGSAASGAAAVFLNTFSLSEMPPEALERNCREIARITSGFFLHHNVDRVGIVSRGHERTPASMFPIRADEFALVATNADLFHGHDGDYREFLYRRLPG